MSEQIENNKERQSNIPTEYKEAIEWLSEQDVNTIVNLLLGSWKYDSYVNMFVKHFTWQEELQDNQRLLLAPANWIENTINFFCSLFTQKGRQDIVKWIQNVTESPEILRIIWEVFYKRLNSTQKVAVWVEYWTNVFSLYKSFWKLLKLLNVLAKSKWILLSARASSVIGSTKTLEDLQDLQAVIEAKKLL